MSLFSILLLAFGLRIAWRVHMGGPDFWANGYSFFYDLATNLVAGRGLGIDGAARAMRMPLYPAFLALTQLASKNYLSIVVPQALMGAGTTLCTFLIGRELFGSIVGLLASLIAALYPYYVVHDTALQETGMFTFLTALSVFLLLRAGRSASFPKWVAAGLALGAAVLTRQTLAPFAIGALLWLAWRRKVRQSLAAGLPFALLVGAWLIRNEVVVGSPILSSEFGRQLWNANNSKTFSHYPAESIDRSADEAFDALSVEERKQLEALSGNEVGESEWFRGKGLDYVRTHPFVTLSSAVRKVAAGFSWRCNPKREPIVQAVYLASYGPISILGVLGLILARRFWREHSLIYLLFSTFIGVTAIFWSHTSHRSYLDVYFIVFAAYAIHRSAHKLLGIRMRPGV